MREVDQSQHTEDEGVADGHQGIDRAPGQSVDGELPEAFSQVIDVETDVAGEAGVLADALVDHLRGGLLAIVFNENAPEPSGLGRVSRTAY